MNRSVIVSLVVLVLAVSGLIYFPLSSKDKNPSVNVSNEAVPKTQETDASNSGQASGSYVEYTKQAFNNSSAGRRVLFFYASWCPTCKPADANFRDNESKIPVDVTVIRVNYNDPQTDNEEKDLARRYGITYQHTFVQIDANGNEVAKWNGGQTSELLARIK